MNNLELQVNKEYTVADLIKDLQKLKPSLQKKPVFFRTPNSELHKPVARMILDDDDNFMSYDGKDHVIGTIITY